MPKRILWTELALASEACEGESILERLKAFDICKSNTLVCTVCTLAVDPHKMRYRLLKCKSETCSEASEVACSWRGKLLTCLSTSRMSIYESGAHTTLLASPQRKKKLTTAQKTFCREMAAHHLRPQRIRHALARKFDTSLENLPGLQVVQNFVNHYSRSSLQNHDRVDEMRDWVHARVFTGEEALDQPFTFVWRLDCDGRPVVGNGSNESPFVLGISTKTMIMRLNLPEDSFILHIDATYKMNHRGYPVVVVGVSDRSRGFHLVALYIVSQETHCIFVEVLQSLRRQYYYLSGRELSVRNVMADADRAQYNAICTVFSDCAGFQFLMCFFHVIKNIQKAIKGFPSVVSASLIRDVYDLHFARSEMEFNGLRDRFLLLWMQNPFLVGFAHYMRDQWLYGPFSKWQRYLTPSGFAATNNPSETFNALLKRDYTLRRRLKMGTLVQELADCTHDLSSATRKFSFDIAVPATLTRRVSELMKERLIGVWNGVEPQPAYAGGHTLVYVASQLAKRVQVAPHKRSEEGVAVSAQMGANYARMEVEGQPWGGWPVDITSRWCPCSYCFAFGVCVHVLYALKVTQHVDSSGRNVFVNRNKRKRGGDSSGGRPLSVGPALTF
eukprot:jgi/Phyca11/108692/e_gw1.15.210.1